MIQELIVVEGKNDAQAVRRALGAVDIVWTEGYGLTKEKLEYIAAMSERRGVIVLTDPDSVGEQIRERIRRRVPQAKHIYLSKKDARSRDNRDIGVENASPEDIRRAFEYILCAKTAEMDRQSLQPEDGSELAKPYTIEDLVAAGLTGLPDSAERRRALGRVLGIGDANAKQFLHRLNRFGIERAKFEKAKEKVRDGECG